MIDIDAIKHRLAADVLPYPNPDVVALLAEVDRLRAAMPSEEERKSIGSVVTFVKIHGWGIGSAEGWLARLDAARKGE